MVQRPILTDTLAMINSVIEQTTEDSDRFAETLRQLQIPHLSYSQISIVEACQYRYVHEYIDLVEPDPVPLYFTKGRLLHQIIASAYRKTAAGASIHPEEVQTLIENELEGEHRCHLHNAVRVHSDQRWPDAEVIAVEKPFAMVIAPDLPPCVGVIDLVLQRAGVFVLIDHKTGRDFYPEDELQMAIYVEYMKSQYGEVACEFYYDHYRWVNNLDRIRKPAFQRNSVTLPASYWQTALERIRNGYRIIEQLKNGKRPERNGECFRCPYRGNCYRNRV